MSLVWDRRISGHLMSNWHDRSLRFHVTLNPGHFHTSHSHGPYADINGKGSSYDGQRFKIKHGRYYAANDKVTFEIHYENGEPTELFDGKLNSSNTHVRAKITLKDPMTLPGPGPQSGAYNHYHASVTLR